MKGGFLMKLNDVKRFSAYVSTIYHSEYITVTSVLESETDVISVWNKASPSGIVWLKLPRPECFVVVVSSFQLLNAFSETGYPAFYQWEQSLKEMKWFCPPITILT